MSPGNPLRRRSLSRWQEIPGNPATLKAFGPRPGPNLIGNPDVGKTCRKFSYNFRGLGARGVHSSDNGDSANLPNWHRGVITMSEEGLISLLVIGGAIYLVYLISVFVKAHNKATERNQLAADAAAVQQGMKPMGKPMASTFGSAYFMSPQQIVEAGIGLHAEKYWEPIADGSAGFVLLGLVQSTNGKKPVATILEGPGHVLTIAPTRSGKGTCGVIPNLLNFSGSVVVNDIKGENYAVTQRVRSLLSDRVYRVAPFEDDTDQWNPFSVLAESDDVWEDARHMAELLISDETGKDDFWTNNARNLLTGIILYIHATLPPYEQTLGHLRDLLTQGEEEFQETIAQMLNSGNKIATRAANVFQRADTKVQSGILSTLDSQLAFLDSERLVHCTDDSDFSFKELKEHLVTVYLIVPPERLRTYAPFIRLFMGFAALELKRTKTRPKFPVLMMLDEFPALGRMKVIEEEISYLAGYDVRLWLFAQDLKQLTSIYGDKAESIIANCAVKQFFGVSDFDTAKLVSLMCGSTTVPSITYSSSTGINVESSSSGESIGRSARPLLDPNEVMNMDSSRQLLFYQGGQPIWGFKYSYIEHPEDFSAKYPPGSKLKDGPVFDPNPYHQ
jgi:type IV secretion system protein VirD4